jgi:DNA-binding response OmpR family regulator/DNA-binding CsgD family transcriptional regulator
MNAPDELASVLIIDDNPDNLRVAVDHLEAYSIVVRTALDGVTGIRRAQGSSIRLILLDVEMPGIDGYETCKRLKADPELASIPVIFMTSRAAVEDKIRAFEVGAVDYVTKPFEARELLARVQTHLHLNVLQEKLARQNEELEGQVADERLNLKAALAGREALDSDRGALIEMVGRQSEELRRLTTQWEVKLTTPSANPAGALREHVRARLALVKANLRGALALVARDEASARIREHLELAQAVLGPLLQEDAVEATAGGGSSTALDPLRELSDRERDVLRMVAQGLSTSEIANELDVAASTVSTYRKRIREKTGVENITELIALQVRSEASSQ